MRLFFNRDRQLNAEVQHSRVDDREIELQYLSGRRQHLLHLKACDRVSQSLSTNEQAYVWPFSSRKTEPRPQRSVNASMLSNAPIRPFDRYEIVAVYRVSERLQFALRLSHCDPDLFEISATLTLGAVGRCSDGYASKPPGGNNRSDGTDCLNPGGRFLAEDAFCGDQRSEEPDRQDGGEGDGDVAVSVHGTDAGTTVAVRQ